VHASARLHYIPERFYIQLSGGHIHDVKKSVFWRSTWQKAVQIINIKKNNYLKDDASDAET
jgi:hypothetical protein